MNNSNGKNKSNSIEKSLAIMQLLAEVPYKYTAIEISKSLGINRSTVHRILNILEKARVVIQDRVDHKYKLGPTSYKIGSAYLVQYSFKEEVIKIINKLEQETRGSIGYYVKDSGQIMSIYEAESYQPIRLGYQAGVVYPPHCGAVGKCITAFMGVEKITEYVYHTELEKRTPNTITDPDRLLEEYKKIRERGYSISDEENLLGAYGIAAPIFEKDGSVKSCIAIAVIKTGLTEDKIEFYKEKIIEAACFISEKLREN